MSKSVRALLIAILAAVTILIPGCPGGEEYTASQSESGNIIVSEPDPGDAISSPVHVTGQARVFEAALSARVLTEDGREIGLVHIMASEGAPAFGDFSANVPIEVPAGVEAGFVEIYSSSPKDGSPINVVRIPVTFR